MALIVKEAGLQAAVRVYMARAGQQVGWSCWLLDVGRREASKEAENERGRWLTSIVAQSDTAYDVSTHRTPKERHGVFTTQLTLVSPPIWSYL